VKEDLLKPTTRNDSFAR